MAVSDLSLQESNWSPQRLSCPDSPFHLTPEIPGSTLCSACIIWYECQWRVQSTVLLPPGAQSGAGVLSLPVAAGTSNLGCIRKGSI